MMSYISYKLYRMLRIPALIILGVEGLVLGCGMFNLGACFLAMLFGLVPFDIRYLMGPWLGIIFAFIFIFLVNKIPFTASLMYKQLRREYFMHNKKICLPEKEQEGFSIFLHLPLHILVEPGIGFFEYLFLLPILFLLYLLIELFLHLSFLYILCV